MADPAAEDAIAFTISGKRHAIDPEDLELGEVEILEELCDAPLEEIDFRRASAIKGLVYIVMRRNDQNFTIEDAAHIKLSALNQDEVANGNGKPGPTKAGKAGAPVK